MSAPAQWWRSVGDPAGPQNPLLVVALADDDEAVSRLPQGSSGTWAQQTLDGSTPTARVCAYLDVSILADPAPQLPAGHDLVLLAGVGRGYTTAAAVTAAALLRTEPQLCVGYGSGISDVEWMQKVADVRARVQTAADDVPTSIQVLAGILDQASAQSVPVLLDGVVGAAAACACLQLPDTQLPVSGDEPAVPLFMQHMQVPAWGLSGMPSGYGLGALAGLAALRVGLLASDV